MHDLKTLVLSRHPAIVVETPEEQRLDELLASVARDLGLAHFSWTVTQGLVHLPGGAPVYGTEDPLKAIAAIGELGVNGLFVLKDIAPHVATPRACRALGELLDGLAAPSRLSTLVLPGVRVELAAPIEGRAPPSRGARSATSWRCPPGRSTAAPSPPWSRASGRRAGLS